MKLRSRQTLRIGLGIAAVVSGLTMGSFVLQREMPSALSFIPFLAQAGHDADAAQAASEKVTPPSIIFHMTDRVVNLADPGGFRYLKVGVSLEFASDDEKDLQGEAYKKKQDEFAKKLVNRKDKLDDAVMTVLSSHSAAELVTPTGKESLRTELKERVGPMVQPEQLLNVYFTQFIIQ